MILAPRAVHAAPAGAGTTVAWPRMAVAASAAGCAALAARPLFPAMSPEPVMLTLLLFCGLLAIGALWPVPAARHGSPAVWVAVVGIGLAAFAAGRLLGGGHPPQPAVLRLIALSTLAAVAEEAFFRRMVYASLLPGGAALAVGGSALLFAMVHLTVYGAWVLPLDLAAGLVLSWQRWASGSWLAPALTHSLANVLVVV